MKKDLKVKIWNFVKPNLNGVLMSNYIAAFIAETLRTEVVWDDAVNADGALDMLIIVNGAYAFCAHLPALAKAARAARRVVWVQNDYTVVPPKPTSKGRSPFRACWRLRAKDGKPGLEFWTTVQKMATATPFSKYINWNSMAYQPLNSKLRAHVRQRSRADLFYYGAYRKGREEYFHRYFDACPVPLTISGARKEWKLNWPKAMVIDAIKRDNFYLEMATHGLGLYIEDKKSHTLFTSPACRFYEMLSAGLPMVFQPESVPMLLQAKYDVRPYVVQSAADIKYFMHERFDIEQEQRSRWATCNYREQVREQVLEAYLERTLRYEATIS